jgi:hypothetical protein
MYNTFMDAKQNEYLKELVIKQMVTALSCSETYVEDNKLIELTLLGVCSEDLVEAIREHRADFRELLEYANTSEAIDIFETSFRKILQDPDIIEEAKARYQEGS